MSFPTGQNRTPQFAGQVLPDNTEFRLMFLNILPIKFRLSIFIRQGPLIQIWYQKFLDQIKKQKEKYSKASFYAIIVS
jgi:hypothetical protein